MDVPGSNGRDGMSSVSSPRLVVIAASAGGLPAIIAVLAPLPPDFPAAIALVQHRGHAEPHVLIELLARRTRLRVQHAADGAVLEPGTVYVCPPGVHMTTEHCVRLIDGPKQHFVQPNADLMFESVGRAYGDRAIAVVLSGSGTDAALGSLAIAHAGGTVIAQDDRTCAFPEMPEAAAKVGSVDLVMTPAEIALELERQVTGRAQARPGRRSEGLVAPSIKVVLADDHRIFLDGLRLLLESEPDMAVVSSIEDGAAAIRVASELAPDVVVMDIRMPGIDGVEATRQILAALPVTRVVALSAESDARTVDGMLRAGACGYLTKQRAFGELVDAIRSVMQGRIYLSHEVARMVTAGAVAAPAQRPRRGL
jgi:two-component system, chemotaxis family, protein-glutamate methylesterase/glutaminase